jgi:hypothetical protein
VSGIANLKLWLFPIKLSNLFVGTTLRFILAHPNSLCAISDTASNFLAGTPKSPFVVLIMNPRCCKHWDPMLQTPFSDWRLSPYLSSKLSSSLDAFLQSSAEAARRSDCKIVDIR